MADHTDHNGALPKADRRGNTILVPIGIAVVFVVLAVFMLMRNSPQGEPPPPKGQTAIQTSGQK